MSTKKQTKVSKQDRKTFPMKNVIMIRPKRNETKKMKGWHQQSHRVPWPVYDSRVAGLTL